MFRSFFFNKRWYVWSWLGSVIILFATWYKVQLDVQVNEWFGDFYNAIQQALTNPGTVQANDIYGHLWTFLRISAIFIAVAILLEFFMRHYVFRWRTAMHGYYMKHWDKVRHIEGASQRVQEDTMRFANIVERLGVSFLRSLMTLLAFQPVLWELSKQVKSVPFFGEVEHVLIYVAILSALFGTVLLAVVGVKLPGLEFNNQKAEAALRKELVLGEDDHTRAQPQSMKELFQHVRTNYVTMYRHYLYFDLFKVSYLQLSSILPYIMLTPTIIAGLITFGTMQQIIRAFNKVEGSLHYLVFSWSTIVELISVYKRLKAFEQHIQAAEKQEVNYVN
ncbi:putative transporter [Vibrio sp. D404a]|uniref:putative transporter n=1 Tax=unclassified Vibrio TaxID=2614977 RepID=UPI00255715FA|nr:MULTISPECIES: putative transporter [unclassified Vibrio]MDK9737227.1 putative transporter [Vibrio sp. D404a]MDK9797114.1 putative transporter [Vibrio sp. D449a]